MITNNVSDTDFHYAEMSANGVRQLEFLSYFTEDDCKRLCFSNEEIAAAYDSQTRADGITNGLKCFEFMSANVSKLAYVKKYYAEKMSEVGIICWAFQVEFVKEFFGGDVPNIRVFVDEKLDDIVAKRRELYNEKIATGMD